MRILAFSPFPLDTVSGNVVTLKRIRQGLAARGHEFEIVTVSPSTTGRDAQAHAEERKPDVLHFYHAYKTGRLLPAVDGARSVVTISGTDLNSDFQDSKRRPILERSLRHANRLVTYNSSFFERVKTQWPDLVGKLDLIPKGVVIGDAPYDLRAGDAVVFFLPGGIRPVKDPLFAVEELSKLRGVRLVCAGPILDSAYGAAFLARIRSESWILHIERIPHAAMMSAYRSADVVLNASRSEGISNALMEAMVAGRAILASDIPGNRDLIEDGRTGLLHRRADFAVKAERLARDRDLRESLGRAAAEHAAKTFSVDREVEALLGVYAEVVNGAPCRSGASSPRRPTS